ATRCSRGRRRSRVARPSAPAARDRPWGYRPVAAARERPSSKIIRPGGARRLLGLAALVREDLARAGGRGAGAVRALVDRYAIRARDARGLGRQLLAAGRRRALGVAAEELDRHDLVAAHVIGDVVRRAVVVLGAGVRVEPAAR